MKKTEITARVARQSRTTQAAAADKLDQIVSHILDRLRKGESAKLPGLGTFLPGPKPAFRFENAPKKAQK